MQDTELRIFFSQTIWESCIKFLCQLSRMLKLFMPYVFFWIVGSSTSGPINHALNLPSFMTEHLWAIGWVYDQGTATLEKITFEISGMLDAVFYVWCLPEWCEWWIRDKDLGAWQGSLFSITQEQFTKKKLTPIWAWMIKHVHYFLWDVIFYPHHN